LETTLQPFLKLRSPRPGSVQFVTDFARRTGDLQVLSKPDLQLLALTYELELERNGGDWRLRKDPTQKRVNGAPPGRVAEGEATETKPETEGSPVVDEQTPASAEVTAEVTAAAELQENVAEEPTADPIVEAVEGLALDADKGDESVQGYDEEEGSTSEEDVEDDGAGEWISTLSLMALISQIARP